MTCLGRLCIRQTYCSERWSPFFLPLLESCDIILADKGFTIGDLLPGPIGLNMPPFIASNAQMTQKEFFKTTNCRPYNRCRNENGSNQKLQNRPECTSFD